ncbi:uncharacterized protein LOC141853819 [Brevipalpus obovatus]|uniref:uncharacterized protein LOC141853819 n=1 Tax=Brevipalpus obovatus TaxID=246614 RepID=UPI003D9F0D6F
MHTPVHTHLPIYLISMESNQVDDTYLQLFENNSIYLHTHYNDSSPSSYVNINQTLFPNDNSFWISLYVACYGFKTAYQPIHFYLTLAICSFGLVANMLNIIVLTRKTMHSPTNALLTGLAITDTLVMLDYIFFDTYTFFLPEDSYGSALFVLLHAHFSIVFHGVSTWITICLAVWRLLSVSYPTQSRTWFTMRNAIISIVVTYVALPSCLAPLYFSYEIYPREPTGYMVTSVNGRTDLEAFNFFYVGILIKLIPCALLTYCSVVIIRVLMEADRRRARLKSAKTPKPNVSTTPTPTARESNHLMTTTTTTTSNVTRPNHVHRNYGSIPSNNKLTSDDIDGDPGDKKSINIITNQSPGSDHDRWNHSPNGPKSYVHHKGNNSNPSTENQSSMAIIDCPKFGSTTSNVLVPTTTADSVVIFNNNYNSSTTMSIVMDEKSATSNPDHNQDTDGYDRSEVSDESSALLTETPKSTVVKLSSSSNATTTTTTTLVVPNVNSKQALPEVFENSNCNQNNCNNMSISNPSTTVSYTTASTTTSPASSSSVVHDRTTRMLLAVLLIFLITEFPSGILTILGSFYGQEFIMNVYSPLGDMMDLLALFNSAVNFILYCIMSRQFRSTFHEIFCDPCLNHRVGGGGDTMTTV